VHVVDNVFGSVRLILVVNPINGHHYIHIVCLM